MTDDIRVFVNGAAVSVRRGSTALDAVRVWNASEADAIVAGVRLLTDSRGLPTSPATPMPAGSIVRTQLNRVAETTGGEPFPPSSV